MKWPFYTPQSVYKSCKITISTLLLNISVVINVKIKSQGTVYSAVMKMGLGVVLLITLDLNLWLVLCCDYDKLLT